MTNLVIGQVNGFQGNTIVQFCSKEPLFPEITLTEIYQNAVGDFGPPFLMHPDEWFTMENAFRSQGLPSFLLRGHALGDFPCASRHQFHSLSWLASYQSNGIYFQRVVPNLYRESKVVTFEERGTLTHKNGRLKIHDRPDAIYFQSEGVLAFRNPRAILPILGTYVEHLHQSNEGHMVSLLSSDLFDFSDSITRNSIFEFRSVYLRYLAEYFDGVKYNQRRSIVEALRRKLPHLSANRSGSRVCIYNLSTLEAVLGSLEEELYRADDYLGRSIYSNYVDRSFAEDQNYLLLSA